MIKVCVWHSFKCMKAGDKEEFPYFSIILFCIRVCTWGGNINNPKKEGARNLFTEGSVVKIKKVGIACPRPFSYYYFRGPFQLSRVNIS